MAAGNILFSLVPQSKEAGTSRLDTRNAHTVLDFATSETAIFKVFIPWHYGGGGITVYISWGATSATSGNGQWDVSFERVGETQDIDSDSFAAAQSSGTVAVPATSGVMKTTAVAFTDGQIDGLVAGEWGRMRVTRNASGNHTGDSEIYGVVGRETPA